jgi:hypothetical protein
VLPRLLDPHFHWSYSYLDSETWGYVGLLPLVAALTYPLWRTRSRGPAALWLAIALVGLLLSLAGLGPLGQLLHRIPLYGGERFQSRNIAILDLGLAGLLACWVDVSLATPKDGPRSTWRLALSWLPSLGMVATAVVALLAIGATNRIPLALLAIAIALAYALILWRAWPARAAALGGLVALDLGLAACHLDWRGVDLATLLQPTPTSAALAAALGPQGRFGSFDPALSVRTTEGMQLSPDLPLLLDLPSVEGHGSAVDAVYHRVTDAHTWSYFAPTALGDDTADALNLRLFLLPEALFPEGTAGLTPEVAAALSPPHWRERERLGPYRAFENMRAKGRVWLEAAGPADSVAVERIDAQDGETDHVSAVGPTVLVRSVAYGDGWTASVDRGETTLPAQRHGLVQSVALPGGQLTVTWSYDPPGLRLGRRLSLAALLGLIGLGLWLLLHRLAGRVAASPADSLSTQ